MNTFYICRHGETENNKARRLSGWIDTPLTVHGLQGTQAAIAKLSTLPIGEMYASDLGRAFITAYVISRKLKFSGEIQRSPGLREVNYGDAANMLRDEAYKKYPQLDRDTNFTPPNGESLAKMQQRVLQTLAQLNDMHADATILLVAHSGVIAAIRAAFLGTDFGRHNISEEYAFDFVGKFTVDNGKIASFMSL